MHFFGQRIGDGFLVRGDAGLATFIYTADRVRGGDSNRSNSSSTQHSSLGYGALGGVGYAFPIANGSRMIVGVNYAVRAAVLKDNLILKRENLRSTTFSLTAGILF
jgi:hypothetical protein